LVKRKNKKIRRARNPITRMYQELQDLKKGGFSSGDKLILFF
jgi:hypothetical protein